MIELVFGLLILFISMIVQVIIPPIPAELIVISSGKLYGVLLTTLVAGAGLYIGSILVYYLGYLAHRRFDRFFNKRRVKSVIERLKLYEDWILWVRILPYNPSDILSYSAGIMHFDKKKFFITSFFTSFTRCFLLALMGSYVSSIKAGLYIVLLLIVSFLLAHYALKKGSLFRKHKR